MLATVSHVLANSTNKVSVIEDFVICVTRFRSYYPAKMDVMQTAEPTANPANSPTCSQTKQPSTSSGQSMNRDRSAGELERRRGSSSSAGKQQAGYSTHRPGVRGDGAGDEHHVEGDDDLDDERVPVRARRRGGADDGDGVEHRLEHKRRAHRPRELRRPVERHLRACEYTYTSQAN